MREIVLALALPIAGVAVGSWLVLERPTGEGLLHKSFAALPARTARFLFSEKLDVDLQLAGWDLDGRRFRARQVAVGALGAFGAALLLGIVAVGRDSPARSVIGSFEARQVVVLCVGCALGPGVGYEVILRRRAEKARDSAVSELAVFADSMCIAISAGESVRSALALVAPHLQEPLRGEVESVVASVAAGAPLSRAVWRMAERLDRPLARVIAETLSRAHERGVGLADQLRALAKEVREGQKAAVVESMGRRQVLMVVPVVFLILPTALAFAALPGLYTLQLAVG